ncbi:hypothetical protein C6501_12575 [Candidatus Poribacteria bacterium]|nr:MAG: hypothetical protein C6501_12575 [Candidatus Poribacteria bacterium]
MLKRSFVLIMLIVCVFSFVSINNISYAGTSLNAWLGAERDVRNAERVMYTERDQYHSIRDDLKTLIDEWEEAKIANDKERLLSVIAITGAIISVASGGSLYPAAYVAAVAKAKLEYSESKYNVQKSAYLTSMSALVSLMDRARSNVNAAYNGGYLDKKPPGASVGSVVYLELTPGYDPEYDAYLGMAVNHLNAYEWYVGRDYRNVRTLTIEYLEPTVKGGGLNGWNHRRTHDGDEHSGEDHGFEKFMTFADFVVEPDLPKKYPCKGDGREMFRTPSEAFFTHRVKCGEGYTVAGTGVGCGKTSYTCDNGHSRWADWHKIRECGLTYLGGDDGVSEIDCTYKYRNCTSVSSTHAIPDYFGNLRNTLTNCRQSDKANSRSTTTQQTTAPSPSPTPSPPAMHPCNVHQAWQSGDHSAAGCGTSGHYACDGSNHAAASCGHASHYACDGLTHVQEQCTITNSNGDRCTYTFWRCLHPTVPSYGPSHVHAYPAPPPVVCARSACGQTVSNRLDHRIDCSNCNGHYWTCVAGATANHTTTFTCRRPGCGVTFTRCSNGTCTSDSGTHTYHWAR